VKTRRSSRAVDHLPGPIEDHAPEISSWCREWTTIGGNCQLSTQGYRLNRAEDCGRMRMDSDDNRDGSRGRRTLIIATTIARQPPELAGLTDQCKRVRITRTSTGQARGLQGGGVIEDIRHIRGATKAVKPERRRSGQARTKMAGGKDAFSARSGDIFQA